MYATEFLDLPPLRSAAGTVRLPGSKSISNRVLLLAGLSEGSTLIHDLLDSDDTRVMIAALQQLGCIVEPEGAALRVTGLGGRLSTLQAKLFLGNAGTAMRPLAAALALLSGLQGGSFELGGVPRMHERPIGDLVTALRSIGCRIDYLGAEGYPPLRLAGGEPRASAPIRVRGDVSSQFLTALLLALPLLSYQGDVVVEVEGELISKPYIEITLNLLSRFGIAVLSDGWSRFTIRANSRYRSPGNIHVEGDASSASYFIALGALAADASAPLRIEGVGAESIQGDIRFVEAAQAMGARVQQGPNWLEVSRGTWPLRPLDLDCNHIPDAAMTLAVMALYASGPTRLRNVASWRVKETDRIAAMAAELRKLGATVTEGPDFIEVQPLTRWRAAAIHTYDDHRVAMCFSLAAFNGLAGAQPAVPVRILDPKCVAKTFPDYFETLFGAVRAESADVPVITIDGPTASGKGTLASEVARGLGYHLLDSGALYRATALAALQAGVPADDEAALSALAAKLPLRFDGEAIWLGDDNVSRQLRREEVGALASRISALPGVRAALRDLQLAFRRLPGLVADGRDMGTVIFPDAALKVFLTASAATRADRRHKQLISKGFSSNIDDLLQDLEARDARDRSRSAAPLKPAEDAVSLDNSALSIDESVQRVLEWWQQRRPF
ncbi:bifunctional 3-phosphoshikimate 1-carboxyvinyltransferase/cytidylate kinase [Schlegelella sp. S2-27]|uniref:Multifunctional fusion protein n=1 Tax=Caldimonas mangrovi TaxID=2944811 RepID=A0ABT0YH49_9BURK|nr:bifunctional 3-phosphoshikimate 1-carboxyvinyltransferase/cytidylate kinase [Caldimonas mangrovi]MCM5678052.1 bifunctional 3-phosphoshikimate 1-carboxyvinyltransferase/cytidylate kinase [Caldimonas mangrovi]